MKCDSWFQKVAFKWVTLYRYTEAAYQRAREMEEALETEYVMQEDEELFKHYTAVCMEEWKSQGKDLKPMMLELTKRNKVTF
jgi:hypothetical protein